MGWDWASFGSLHRYESGTKLGVGFELAGSLVPLGAVGPFLAKICAFINKQARN